MPLQVFLISRDASATDGTSETARRLRSYESRGASIVVAPLVTAADALRVLSAGMRIVARGWVVTSQDPFEAGLVAWIVTRRKGAALELQLHGDFFGPAWRRERWHRPLRLLLARFLLRRADGVRVPGRRIARSLEGIVPIDRIAVVPVAAPAAIPREAPSARPMVLYAGRFSREKDLPMLVGAFRRLRASVPAARLMLRGDGPERARLMALVRQVREETRDPDAITVMPWTSDPAAVLAGASVCALASRHESWSRFAVLAALAGCPVVMTDVGCAGEVIRDGESGWVVPVGDAPRFAAALLEAIGDSAEAARRARNAQEAARRLPAAEEIGERVVAAWRAIAPAA